MALSRRDLFGAVVTAATARIAFAGDCAHIPVHPYLWSNPNEELPPDGAIVLGLRSGRLGDDTARDPFARTFVLATQDRIVASSTRVLAPAVRLLVPAAPYVGALSIRGLPAPNAAPTVRYSATARPALPAPELISVQHETSTPTGSVGLTHRRTEVPVSVAAMLRSNPPESAGWLLLFAASDASNVRATALCGETIGAATTRIFVYRTPGRCGAQIPGAALPPVGISVIARYLDRWGRLSPASPPVTIRGS